MFSCLFKCDQIRNIIVMNWVTLFVLLKPDLDVQLTCLRGGLDVPTKLGLLNKSLCLAAPLSLTKIITVKDIICAT